MKKETLLIAVVTLDSGLHHRFYSRSQNLRADCSCRFWLSCRPGSDRELAAENHRAEKYRCY